MASESVTVYLKGDRNVEVTKRDVTLGDILEIECADKLDRKSTRLNSSHITTSYAVFCLKKKKKKDNFNNVE